MQKKPMYCSSRTVVSLMAAAATMPLTITSTQAGEGGSSYSGMSGLAQREMIRRQQAVAEADRLFLEGREAYAKGDFQQAVDKYRQALSTLPEAPTLSDRRKSYTEHLSDASVALAQQFRKVGKYDEARALLDGVLSPDVDPNNSLAKTELGYLDDPIRTNPALTYEHTKNVDEVRRTLYMAQGYYDLGKFDNAKTEYENVLRVDPYNSAARRGMERVAAAKSDYYRAAYDQTRAELLMQVDKAWELAVPADVPVFDETLTSEGPSNGVAYITEKLRRIIIPRIDFEDTTVEEAIDFLRLRAAELDTLELDPAKKGVNFVIRKPRNASLGGDTGLDSAAGGDALLGGSDPGALRIEELRLRNVPLAVALKYIGDATKLRYKVDDFAVTMVPQTDTGEELFSRTFRVPPDFAASLNAGGDSGGGTDIDPFAENTTGTSAGSLTARPPIIDLLRNAGITFPDGSSATLGAGGSLLVTNTPAELDKVEQLVDLYRGQEPKQVKITTKFVEISQENNDELGFDWIVTPFGLTANTLFASGGTLGNGSTRSPSDFVTPTIPGIQDPVTNIVTGGLRSGDQAVNRNNIDAILNNPNRTSQNANVAPGILGLTGLFSDGQVQVIMRGLAQKKGTDLMTAPSVTARSGQKANIEVIREFIYPTEYEPPELPNSVGVGGVGGGLGGVGGGSTTSFPVTPATPTAFETKNTGVTLEIEPTIGENDFVIDLRFLPEIVEFEGFINYGSPIFSPGTDILGNPVNTVITENRIEMPVFSKRSVNTSLTIYDGYTVAVGGLMREDVQNVEDKVPILGDIPIIGRLFQTKGENRIKSNLIIFVTAQIIDATGRPLRGAEAATTPVTTGGDDFVGGGILPELPE
ncbi:MAG: Amuc_1098 family type IV pilus outer membrane protein [Akkermansiaceae bacterium]